MRTLTRTIVGLEYRALRTPLAIIDGALIQRLSEGSRVRRAFDSGVHRFDRYASSVLSPERPGDQPGTAKPAATRPAARPKPEPAAEQDTPAVPAEELPEQQELIVEAILSPEEEHKHVGELADADEQTKLELAELRAKHKLMEMEQERAMRKGDA